MNNGAPRTSVRKRFSPARTSARRSGQKANRKPRGFYTATDTRPPKTRAVAAKPSACKADER